jgi:cytoskeletal protein RodZ
MNLVGMISTAVLSLTLVAAVPVFAQEQHEQEDQKAKPDTQEEKKTSPEKSPKQEQKPAAQQEKNVNPEEKNTKQEENTKPAERNAKQEEKTPMPAEKNAQPQQRAGNNGGGRIPADKFKASFGQQHRFRVTQADYSSHRFQYGGYSFGFVDAWPSNWLYTQDVYIVEIDGVYYLCNASFPGINLALSFTL